MADATPVHEMSRECANLLVMAADRGEPISEAQLREELGVGHDDLRGMLAQLSDRGMASEVAPGEWSAPDGGEPEAPERVLVSVPDQASPAQDETGPPAGVHVLEGQMFEPTVRITRGIANALDAEALGKLLLAGLADTGDDDVFVLEIVP